MIGKINTWSRSFSVCDVFSKFVHFYLGSTWLLGRIRSDRSRSVGIIFYLSIFFTKALFAFARAKKCNCANERKTQPPIHQLHHL